MPKPPSKVWVELRIMRTRDGHSLTSLADAAGMSLSYLSELENGHRTPNARVLKKLATALRCPISMIEKAADTESVAS